MIKHYFNYIGLIIGIFILFSPNTSFAVATVCIPEITQFNQSGDAKESTDYKLVDAVTNSNAAAAESSSYQVTSVLTLYPQANPQPPEPSCNITATPISSTPGANVTLNWSNLNSNRAFLDNGIGEVQLNSSTTVNPNTSTIYTMSVFDKYCQRRTCSVNVTVNNGNNGNNQNNNGGGGGGGGGGNPTPSESLTNPKTIDNESEEFEVIQPDIPPNPQNNEPEIVISEINTNNPQPSEQENSIDQQPSSNQPIEITQEEFDFKFDNINFDQNLVKAEGEVFNFLRKKQFVYRDISQNIDKNYPLFSSAPECDCESKEENKNIHGIWCYIVIIILLLIILYLILRNIQLKKRMKTLEKKLKIQRKKISLKK